MTIALHLIQILQRPRITVSSISYFGFFSQFGLIFFHLECDDTWELQTIGSRSLCFKHFGDDRSWNEANTLCAAEGASLFMPLNAQENTDFYSYTVSLNIFGVWLDGNDVAVEGEYRTSTGDLITYFNWHQPDGGWHQPDNSEGDEDFIHYFHNTDTHTSGSYWNDWGQQPRHVDHALCQKPSSRKSSCSKTTEVDSSAGLAHNTMTVQPRSLIVTPSLFKLIFFYSSHHANRQCLAAD